MVANGYGIGNPPVDTNTVEIIDFETKMSCAAFPSVPLGIRGGAGGLFDQRVPWVCSGSPIGGQCYLYKNGAWNQTGSFKTARAHFTVVPNSPFGNPGHKFYIVAGDAILTGEVFDGQAFSEMGPPVPFQFYVSCMVYLNPTTVMLIAGTQASATYSTATYVMNSKIWTWQAGPSINVARLAHGCGRIVQGVGSNKYSTIIAGGGNSVGYLNQVELLDDGAPSWRNGPNLPYATMGGAVVEDQRGGILFVGGEKGGYTGNIYRLRHAGAQWESLASSLSIPKMYPSAFLVPDELVNCRPV